MALSVPHLSPPAPGGHWALTSQRGSIALIAPCVILSHVLDGEPWPCPLGLMGILSDPENQASLFFQSEFQGPGVPQHQMVRGAPPGTTVPGSAQMVGLGRVPGRKSEAGSPGVPQAPALSPDLPDSSMNPELPSPFPHGLRETLSPGRGGSWALGQTNGLHLGPQAHTPQPWKRAPVRGVPQP